MYTNSYRRYLSAVNGSTLSIEIQNRSLLQKPMKLLCRILLSNGLLLIPPMSRILHEISLSFVVNNMISRFLGSWCDFLGCLDSWDDFTYTIFCKQFQLRIFDLGTITCTSWKIYWYTICYLLWKPSWPCLVQSPPCQLSNHKQSARWQPLFLWSSILPELLQKRDIFICQIPTQNLNRDCS